MKFKKTTKNRSRASFDKNGKMTDVLDLYGGGVSLAKGSGNSDSPFVKALFPERKSDKKFGMNFQSALGDKIKIPKVVDVKEGDFLFAPFRLISATIVGGGTWKATDFSNEAVLRRSMPLLQDKPVYRNHWMDPDYWLGQVDSLAWGQSYVQSSNGLIIPSGIDGLLAIDTVGKKNQQLARGIVTGSVRSNSVTIEFEWEPSHDFPDEWDFYYYLGEMVEGKMVTRVVTKIIDYHETSIVGLGADPYAKAIKEDGELVDVDLAGASGSGMQKSDDLTDEQKVEKLISFKKLVSSFSSDHKNLRPRLRVDHKEANKALVLNFNKKPQKYLTEKMAKPT